MAELRGTDTMNTSSTYNNSTARGTGIEASNGTFSHTTANQTGVVNSSTEASTLNSHHRTNVSGDNHQEIVNDTPIRRASIAQNAPGKMGEVGENIMGGLGFGGSHVERPVQDHGLGEKIVNFMGA